MIKSHRDAEIEIRRLQDEQRELNKLVRTTKSDVERHARILRNTPIGNGQVDVPVVEVPVEPGTGGGGEVGLGDFPAGTTNTLMDPVEYDTRGGIKYYRVHSTLNKAANIANFVRYSWWYLLYSDPTANPANLLLPTIEFASIPDRNTLVAVSEWQPLPNAITYVRTQVYVENSDGLLNTVGAPLSNIATIGANPGLPGGGSEPTGTFIAGAKVTFGIEYDVKGGIKHYRINGTLDNTPADPGHIANPAGFAEYSWHTALANNSDGSSNYIKEFEFRAVSSISTLTASTDWWVLSDTSKYINCLVYIRNADNILNTTPLSAPYQALTGNPGIAPAPIPDITGHSVTATYSTTVRDNQTYFKISGKLDTPAGADTVAYAWYYQQTLFDGTIEYPRVPIGTEYRTSFLTIETDFWPLADANRKAYLAIIFLNKDGVGSTSIITNTVDLAPNPGAPLGTFPTDSPPLATTLSIAYENRGGSEYYQLHGVVNRQANTAGFSEYSWRCSLSNDSLGNDIFLNFEFLTVPIIGTLEAYSDWWPIAAQGKYIKVICRIRNVDNTLDAGPLPGQISAVLPIKANPGLSVGEGTFPTSPATTCTLNIRYEQRGVETYYRLNGVLNQQANAANFTEYSWWCIIYGGVGGSGGVEKGWTEWYISPLINDINVLGDWWPMASLGKSVKIYCQVRNSLNVLSSQQIVSAVQDINPNQGLTIPAPTFPAGTLLNITVEYSKIGDINYYRVITELTAQANSANFAMYRFWARILNAAGDTVIKDWVPFFDTSVISMTKAVSDYWPYYDTTSYVQTIVHAVNATGQWNQVLSNPFALVGNTGINPKDVVTLGNGTAWDSSGNLVATTGGLKNPNYDFVDDPNAVVKTPKDWNMPYPNWTVIPGTDPDAYSGNGLRYLEPATAAGYSHIGQTVTIIPGKSYRLVVYAKSSNYVANFGFVINDKNGANGAYYAIALPQSATYQPSILNFTIPADRANTAFIIVYLAGNIAGTKLCIDNWDFFPIDTWDQVTLEQQQTEDKVRIKQFGVAQNQIKDLEVIFGKLGNGSVKDAKIAADGISDVAMYKDLSITDDTMFQNLVIGKAKVGSVYAVYIAAGRIDSCSIYQQANNVGALLDSFYEASYRGSYGGIRVQNTSAGTTQRSIVTAGGVACMSQTGDLIGSEMYSNGNLGGMFSLRNSSGNPTVTITGSSGQAQCVEFQGVSSSTMYTQVIARPGTGGLIQIWNNGGNTSGSVVISLDGVNGKISATNVYAVSAFYVNNIPVVGPRQATISFPGTDGASLQTAVNRIISCLATHGLIY